MSVYKKDDAEHLELSIESILSQTYEDILLLIGSDGVIDEQLGRVLRLYEDNSKVKTFWFAVNRGLTAVLNDLLVEAKRLQPAFIARMDADDVSKADRFEKQVRFLENNSDVDVVGGAIEEIDYKGEVNGKVIRYPLTHKECFRFFSFRNPLAHPAVMFRSSFFNKVASYNAAYKKNQDTELWYRAFKVGCVFANIPDVVLSFRVSDNMYKRRGGNEFAKEVLKLRLEINKGLNYGLKADILGYCYYLMAISPSWVKKIAYKTLR